MAKEGGQYDHSKEVTALVSAVTKTKRKNAAPGKIFQPITKKGHLMLPPADDDEPTCSSTVRPEIQTAVNSILSPPQLQDRNLAAKVWENLSPDKNVIKAYLPTDIDDIFSM